MTEPENGTTPAAFNLETVKLHTRISHDVEDGLLLTFMTAAVGYAESFLGYTLDVDNLQGTVLAGLLLHVALLYEDRDGEFMEKNLKAIKLLYWPYRRLSV